MMYMCGGEHVNMICHAHVCLQPGTRNMRMPVVHPPRRRHNPISSYFHIAKHRGLSVYLHDDQPYDDPEGVGSALGHVVAELGRLFLERALDVLLGNVLLLLQQWGMPSNTYIFEWVFAVF